MSVSTVTRQTVAVMRLEWRRLFGWRAVWLTGLALFPVALMTVAAVMVMKFGDGTQDLGDMREGFANLYHGLFVRIILFFGCLSIFVGQIRGEVEGRSLHYLFLTPVPRAVVTVGKYLAGLTLAWAFFVGSTVVTHGLAYLPFGSQRWLDPVAMRELLLYCGMTILGCAGYGAAFLLIGTLLRGPGWFVALFFAWEWFQFLLPPILKQLSVVYYVKSLTPVPISEGPFALLAEPTPMWLASLQLVLYVAIAVTVASLVVRRMEINYSGK